MRALKIFAKSMLGMLCGKRHVSFYFSTLTFFDSLLSLLYSLAVLLRLPVARGGRARFTRLVQEMFCPEEIYLYGSARSALYALLRSLELAPGSEVIITGFTCEVVPNAVINAGLRPVYADIEALNFGMSPESVQRKITEKTKVIVIQHTFGIPAEIDHLLDLARKKSLYIVEDCAVSLGSYYKGKLTGTFGDAAIFSFELSKTITSCRGGVLILNTNNLNAVEKHDRFYKTVPEQRVDYSNRILMQLGLSGILYRPLIFNLGKYVVALFYETGYFKKSTSAQEMKAEISDHYMLRLSDEQAVILCRQLNRLGSIRRRSSSASKYYYKNLKEVPGLVAYRYPDEVAFNLIRYPILTKKRKQLTEEFEACDVDLGLWFTAPLSSLDVDHSLFHYTKGECPVAEGICSLICNLPTNVRLNKRSLLKITDLCKKVVKNVSQ